jgi:hypothetical protein
VAPDGNRRPTRTGRRSRPAVAPHHSPDRPGYAAPYQASSPAPSEVTATAWPAPHQSASQTLRSSAETRAPRRSRRRPARATAVPRRRRRPTPRRHHAGTSCSPPRCRTEARQPARRRCLAMPARMRAPSADQRCHSTAPGRAASCRSLGRHLDVEHVQLVPLRRPIGAELSRVPSGTIAVRVVVRPSVICRSSLPSAATRQIRPSARGLQPVGR